MDYSGDYPTVEIEDAAVDICRSPLEVEWTRGTLMTRMTEPVLTDRKTGKGRKSGQESIPMSIEMRTQTGAVLRIRGNLDAAMIQAIIQASSSHV